MSRSFRIAPHRYKLSGDADGNLLRRERADFQAHRRIDALELLRAIPFFFESLVDGDYFALATNHADIARWSAHRPGQNAHIFLVAARHDYEIGRGVRLNFCEGFVVAGDHFLRHWKTLQIREGF